METIWLEESCQCNQNNYEDGSDTDYEEVREHHGMELLQNKGLLITYQNSVEASVFLS